MINKEIENDISYIREALFNAISHERIRQETLHKMDLENFSNEKMLAVLIEEVGEVGKALQENNDNELKIELIQVASVCMRWIEKQYLKKKYY